MTPQEFYNQEDNDDFDNRGAESIIKVVSQRDDNDNEESMPTEKSEAKQKIFSGHDSLLREVISHTPRTFEEIKEETTNHADYLK